MVMFPGNHSCEEQKAVAKIQSVFGIKAMQCIILSLGAFTKNDQSARVDDVSTTLDYNDMTSF